MPLSREVVRRIAMLARLELGEADEVAVTEQLDHILQHLETLAALDTAEVAPTAHVVDMAEAYREDVVSNVPAAEALRANAPARDGDFFKVPKIID